jgi:phosphatidylglycerophosphatase A
MSVLRRITVALSTGLGLGYSPVAPGTVASVWGVLIALAIHSAWREPWQQALAAALLAAVAIPICDVGEKNFGTKDPHAVVADEYLTFPLCVIGLPAVPWIFAVAFVSNRALDILKPFPARSLQALPGGWGIVVDDVISALYSLAFNHAAWWIVTRSGWF